MSGEIAGTETPADPGARVDRWRARGALVLGPALFLLIWFLPLGLEEPAHRLAAVMALVVTFWIGEPVPVAVTALLAPCLALLTGAVPPGDAKASVKLAFSGFGDPILMLFVGGFFIAEAMTVHGLDRRLAMSVLSIRAFSASPARLVIGLGLCAWVLSMWMSNTATTALLIPIALGMLRVSRGSSPPGPTDTAALLMIPFAATVGGLGTPVGTAPNLIGISQMRRLAGADFGFLTWMGYGVPIGAGMIVALAAILSRKLPQGAVDLRAHALAERSRMGPWTRGERITLAAFALAVGGWIFSGLAQAFAWRPVVAFMEARLPEGAIALFASSILFALPASRQRPTLTWAEATRIDWGTLLLLGGGLSMGELMSRTGLSAELGQAAVDALQVHTSFALIVFSTAFAIALSEITSNVATATMLVPVVISISTQAGVDPIPPALAATLGCSFGFMLPISTPPNALAYGTGLIPIATMARKGIVFDLIGLVLIVAGVLLLSPVLGH